MLSRTHLAFSLLIITILTKFMELPFWFVVFFFLSSLIPDIDRDNSKTGRKTWPASVIISILFKHRGFIHSVFIPAGLYFLFFLLGLSEIALGVSMGYLSHLLLDGLSVKGIRPLYPLTNANLRGPIRVNSLSEHILFLMSIGLAVFLLKQ